VSSLVLVLMSVALARSTSMSVVIEPSFSLLDFAVELKGSMCLTENEAELVCGAEAGLGWVGLGPFCGAEAGLG